MEEVEFINKIFKIYAYVRNKDEANNKKIFLKDNIIIESCNTMVNGHINSTFERKAECTVQFGL